MKLEQMIDRIIAGCRLMIARALEPVDGRLKSLEARPLAAPVDRDGLARELKESLSAELEKGIRSIKPQPTPDADQIAKAMEPIFSVWALGFERKADDILQRAIDRMPQPKDGKDGERGVDGRDGKDAFDLDSFACELGEDGRTVTLSFRRGDEVLSKSVKLPAMLYKGVFAKGAEYSENDVVTYGGSMFIATKDAPDGAPGSSDDWKLSVKRGRDGKDGRNGIDKTATVAAKQQ